MSEIRVQVLGLLRVVVDGVEQGLGGRRERVVLAVLVAAGGSPVTSDRLVDEVWGDDPPATASGSLQVAVSRLRTALDPARRPGSESRVLLRGQAGYLLDGVTVDAVELSVAAATAPNEPPVEAPMCADVRRCAPNRRKSWDFGPGSDAFGWPRSTTSVGLSGWFASLLAIPPWAAPGCPLDFSLLNRW